MTGGVRTPAPPSLAVCANFVTSCSSRVCGTGNAATLLSRCRCEGDVGRFGVYIGARPVADSTLSIIGAISASPLPLVQITFTKDRPPQGRKAPTVPWSPPRHGTPVGFHKGTAVRPPVNTRSCLWQGPAGRSTGHTLPTCPLWRWHASPRDVLKPEGPLEAACPCPTFYRERVGGVEMEGFVPVQPVPEHRSPLPPAVLSRTS